MAETRPLARRGGLSAPRLMMAGFREGLAMSKVIRGFVVSKNPANGFWRAWEARGEMGSFCADSYRGLLAMIRDRRA